MCMCGDYWAIDLLITRLDMILDLGTMFEDGLTPLKDIHVGFLAFMMQPIKGQAMADAHCFP